MIKKMVIAAAMATAGFAATPALAQDMGGARVALELGVIDDDFMGTEDATYGVNAGYDFDLGNIVAGPVAGYTGSFGDDFDARELSIGGRVGAPIGTDALFYGVVSYSNIDADYYPGSIDGVKFGLGLEKNFNGFYGMVETRYGNYEMGGELYQTVIGAGFKF